MNNLLCPFRVKVQGHEEGRIYPPLLMLKYGEVTQEDIEANVEVLLTFIVEYEMENSLSHAIEVGQKFFSFYLLCFTCVSWQQFCLSHYVQTVPAATLYLFPSYLSMLNLKPHVHWYLFFLSPSLPPLPAAILCLPTVPILLFSILSLREKYVRSQFSIFRLGCGMENSNFDSW